MKKMLLTIPVPEYSWVDCEIEFETPIGVVYEELHAKLIIEMLDYLKTLGGDVEWLINANAQHIREPFCRELVRNRLWFLTENHIYLFSNKLSHLLHNYRKVSGRNFFEEIFDYKPTNSGKLIQFKDFTKTFESEKEAMKHIATVHIVKSFDYELVEE